MRIVAAVVTLLFVVALVAVLLGYYDGWLYRNAGPVGAGVLFVDIGLLLHAVRARPVHGGGVGWLTLSVWAYGVVGLVVAGTVYRNLPGVCDSVILDTGVEIAPADVDVAAHLWASQASCTYRLRDGGTYDVVVPLLRPAYRVNLTGWR